jgi:hypothetical protein
MTNRLFFTAHYFEVPLQVLPACLVWVNNDFICSCMHCTPMTAFSEKSNLFHGHPSHDIFNVVLSKSSCQTDKIVRNPLSVQAGPQSPKVVKRQPKSAFGTDCMYLVVSYVRKHTSNIVFYVLRTSSIHMGPSRPFSCNAAIKLWACGAASYGNMANSAVNIKASVDPLNDANGHSTVTPLFWEIDRSWLHSNL